MQNAIRFVLAVISLACAACAQNDSRLSGKQSTNASARQAPASASGATLNTPSPATAHESSVERALAPSRERDAMPEILLYALSLVGVKYQFGGNSVVSGFDCSGFVRHVFSQVTAMVLPRRAEDMSRIGDSIAEENLVPGDLVFYNTTKRAFSHVGIFLGESRFIHSPSVGRSVEIVNMQDAYWRQRYNGARRVAVISP